MSYENAPATKILATHCAACSRPLLDATSVEIGMGPECRKKYGYDEIKNAADEVARRLANDLIGQIARAQRGPVCVVALAELKSMGFNTVADRLARALARIVIEGVAGGLEVKAPYNEGALGAWRTVPGRRWLADRKVSFVPEASKGALLNVLKAHYPGETGIGPKGLFVL